MTTTQPAAMAVDPEVLERLDARLRDAVRREGIDPQRDSAQVRRMAEDVVRAHDELSLTGQVTPVGDAVAVVAELVARVAGFGALQAFLDDPEVEEVWINDPCQVRKRPPAGVSPVDRKPPVFLLSHLAYIPRGRHGNGQREAVGAGKSARTRSHV